MDKIIQKLDKIGQTFIDESFHFERKKSLVYRVNGGNLSSAFDNKKQPINVIKWIDDFWVFIEINFILKNNLRKVKSKNKTVFPSIFFSLSIFQGPQENKNKNQLFRAEWNNHDDFTQDHPQPHWHFHFYPYTEIEIENFKEFLNAKKSEDSFIQESYLLDIKKFHKFHFAMNGQWNENPSDVHKIIDESNLVKWFSGLLNHIRKELIYIQRRSVN